MITKTQKRAKDRGIKLSPRQKEFICLDPFPHANCWGGISEHPLYANIKNVFLLDAFESKRLSQKALNDHIQDKTWVVTEIKDDDWIGLNPNHTEFISWLKDHNIEYEINPIRAKDIYGNSLSGFGVIIKDDEDMFLLKLTWQ